MHIDGLYSAVVSHMATDRLENREEIVIEVKVSYKVQHPDVKKRGYRL